MCVPFVSRIMSKVSLCSKLVAERRFKSGTLQVRVWSFYVWPKTANLSEDLIWSTWKVNKQTVTRDTFRTFTVYPPCAPFAEWRPRLVLLCECFDDEFLFAKIIISVHGNGWQIGLILCSHLHCRYHSFIEKKPRYFEYSYDYIINSFDVPF